MRAKTSEKIGRNDNAVSPRYFNNLISGQTSALLCMHSSPLRVNLLEHQEDVGACVAENKEDAAFTIS